jgi:group I intron endonuclease
MPYIYKIINQINGKIYIGKTNRSIKERWDDHCSDRLRFPDRILYRAMNKYGIESFTISVVEEVDTDNIACERERYWIETLGTFKNGYNATLGGDGKTYIDYDLVVATYKQYQNRKKVADVLGIHPDSVTNILKARNEKMLSAQEVSRQINSKAVNMFSLKHEYLRTFISLREAGRYLIDNNLSRCKLSTIKQHISEVCRGKRYTAAKFIWEFA